MRLFQVLREGLDAILVGDVKLVVLDLCKSTMSLERLGLLQLRVLLELLQCGLTLTLVAGCEIDEHGTIVKGRLGVLKSNLADDCETDALGTLDAFEDVMSGSTLFAPVTTPILLYDIVFGLFVMLWMDGKQKFLALLRLKVPHALAVCFEIMH